MDKNVASQKLTVFAFDSTTNLPKSGDAANIAAYYSLDNGTVTVLTDTSATEEDATNAKGYYLFDLAQAETNGDKIQFSAKSSTANIVVLACPAVVYTIAKGTDNLPKVNVFSINNIAATSVTTISAVIGSATTITGDAYAYLVANLGTLGANIAKTGFKIASDGLALVTSWTVAITGNLSGSVGSVASAVSLTGDLTSTMKTSVTTAATAATPTVKISTGSGTGQLIITNGLVGANTILLNGTQVAIAGSGPVTFEAGGTVAFVGSQVDLINAPNATAIAAIQAGLSTYSGGDIAGNVLGSITGTVGGVTGLNTALIDTTISSRLATTSYTAPPSATTIAAAVWNYLTASVTTANSIGVRLLDFVTTLVYAAAPTVIQNRQEMDTNSTKLATIITDIAAIDTGSGGGVEAVTITVDDGNGGLIQNATVALSINASVYTGKTNSSGVVVLAPNEGNGEYSVAVVASGYQFAPTTLDVSGDTAVALSMAAIAITPPVVGFATGWLVARVNGVVTEGIVHTLTTAQAPAGGTGTSLESSSTAVSDVNGLVQFDGLKPGAKYQIVRGLGKPVQFVAGTGTFSIVDCIG